MGWKLINQSLHQKQLLADYYAQRLAGDIVFAQLQEEQLLEKSISLEEGPVKQEVDYANRQQNRGGFLKKKKDYKWCYQKKMVAFLNAKFGGKG